MYFLHAINSDRQTQLLNAVGQIAMILGDKKKNFYTIIHWQIELQPLQHDNRLLQWHSDSSLCGVQTVISRGNK